MKLAQILTEDDLILYLQTTKQPLTAEEHDECLRTNTVWHHGLDKKLFPAVWKAVDKQGKVIYVTNTHRAYDTAPTLQGAIKAYHSFIKSTA